jgi:hypothetical protein
MIEIKNDIFEYAEELSKTYNVLLCITTNGIVKFNGELVMGAGLAKIANAKYHKLAWNLGQKVLQNGNDVYMVATNNPLLNILSFPTKNHWKNPSDVNLIEKSLKQTINYYNKSIKECKVLLPRVGCGLGGLNWEKTVKPLLQQFNLNDDFIICDKNE